MTDRDVVERVAKLFGCKAYKRRIYAPHHKSSFATIARGNRAVALMKMVRPMMGERRGARIDEILARYKPDPKHRVNRSFPSPEEVKRLSAGGLSLRQIGKRLGVSAEYVRRRLVP